MIVVRLRQRRARGRRYGDEWIESLLREEAELLFDRERSDVLMRIGNGLVVWNNAQDAAACDGRESGIECSGSVVGCGWGNNAPAESKSTGL